MRQQQRLGATLTGSVECAFVYLLATSQATRCQITDSLKHSARIGRFDNNADLLHRVMDAWA